jgi:hypothetical protein
MFLDRVLPGLFTIIYEPLIAKCYNTLITCSGNDFIFRFRIRCSKFLLDKHFADNFFCIRNPHAISYATNHHTFVEALEVDSFFSSC